MAGGRPFRSAAGRGYEWCTVEVIPMHLVTHREHSCIATRPSRMAHSSADRTLTISTRSQSVPALLPLPERRHYVLHGITRLLRRRRGGTTVGSWVPMHSGALPATPSLMHVLSPRVVVLFLKPSGSGAVRKQTLPRVETGQWPGDDRDITTGDRMPEALLSGVKDVEQVWQIFGTSRGRVPGRTLQY